MPQDGLPIAVVGAGFSGTITALQLLGRIGTRSVLLCERAPTFARGAAYSTDQHVHLLNVRAANMSAFPDRPDDFVDWMKASQPLPEREIHETLTGTFVSRELYGRYLSSLVRDVLKGEEGALRLRIVPDEVVDLQPLADGYRLVLAGGREHKVAGAVLAVGNLLPANGGSGILIANPWSDPFAQDLVPGKAVAIMGSGLTMVDVVMRLWTSGFPGPVVALSRRGLLPQVHALTVPWPTPTLGQADRGSLTRMSRKIRAEVAAARQRGIGWQSVVDSLRPITSSLWRGLPEAEQKRFLRHLRPWWEVHRHRMAPPIGQQLSGLIRTGFLTIKAGRVLSIDPARRGARISYKPRRSSRAVVLQAQKVIDATGPAALKDLGDPLIRSLVERGLARLDRHGLGIDVTDRFEIIAGDGRRAGALWALGPVVRGVFWECTAVPDIRLQARALAVEVEAAVNGVAR